MAHLTRAFVATAVLAALLVVAPLPSVAWASEAVTRTTRPAMEAVQGRGAVARGVVVPSSSRGELGGHLDDEHAADEEHGTGPEEPADVTAPVSSASETGIAPFVSLGVSLDRLPEVPAAFRVEVDGVWSEWRELPFEAAHAPEGAEGRRARTRVSSEPFWVGGATGYEIEVDRGAGEVAVHLISEERERVLVEPELPAAGASISIRSRSEWGARPPARALATAPSLELAVIHHTDTSNAYSEWQVDDILRSVQAYHMDVNGWDDIAYNFAIDRFGRAWEARAGGIRRAIIGGHAYGFNTSTTGVVVLGDYESTAPTAASVSAIGELVAWKFAQHQTPVTGSYTYRSAANTHFGPAGTPVTLPRIVGHRDVRQTACPGLLHSYLGGIRAHAQSRYPTYQASAPSRPLVGDHQGDLREDLLLYRPGSSTDPRWRGLVGPSFTTSSTNISSVYEPLEGDFDANGVDDILWYAVGPARDYLWLHRRDGTYVNLQVSVSGQYEPYVGDFDGNGADDVLWHGEYGGADHVWWFGAGGARRSTPVSIHGRVSPLIGDFDGDGRSDVLLYGPGSNGDAAWYGRATGGFDVRSASVAGFYRPVVGDFNGDSIDDIFWYAPGSGTDHVWSGRTTRGFSSTTRRVNGSYQPFAGDFDGNGMDDIFWYGPGGAADHQWWHVAGGWVDRSQQYGGDHPHAVLDVDGDGSDEIVWLDQPKQGVLWSAGLLQTTFTGRRVP